MLAQSFKTAADLQLSDAQYDALLKTLKLFEMGEVEWFDTRFDMPRYGFTPNGGVRPKGFKFRFNMSQWSTDFHTCGTVACIGGTAELLAGERLFKDSGRGSADNGIAHLFFPHEVMDMAWDQITVEIAAKALRNFLTTGWPRWETLLPSKTICKENLPQYK